MKTSRMEAFTDGVMAVALTIMVLELSPPETPEWHALLAQWPVALSYILSFIYVGLYWNNHHHLMLTTERINGRDRKSTRLNSSHVAISYAVFCLTNTTEQ